MCILCFHRLTILFERLDCYSCSSIPVPHCLLLIGRKPLTRALLNTYVWRTTFLGLLRTVPAYACSSIIINSFPIFLQKCHDLDNKLFDHPTYRQIFALH